jgi:segregation and condensation protein A
MLLPRITETGEIVIEEDPRKELQGRLLEYMRIKKTAEIFAELEEYNLAIHEKPAEDMSEYLNEPDEILHATEEQMVNAFILFLTRKKKVAEVSRRYQRVRKRKETIEARIEYMTERLETKLREGRGSVSFTELLPDAADRYDVTLSFMSLLSMIRNQGYDAEQKENFGEITVKRKAVQQIEQMETQQEAEQEAVQQTLLQQVSGDKEQADV